MMLALCLSNLDLSPAHARTAAPARGRRGYLFTGSPGSGKTSLVTAIAGELGLPVYVLSLTGACCCLAVGRCCHYCSRFTSQAALRTLVARQIMRYIYACAFAGGGLDDEALHRLLSSTAPRSVILLVRLSSRVRRERACPSLPNGACRMVPARRAYSQLLCCAGGYRCGAPVGVPRGTRLGRRRLRPRRRNGAAGGQQWLVRAGGLAWRGRAKAGCWCRGAEPRGAVAQRAPECSGRRERAGALAACASSHWAPPSRQRDASATDIESSSCMTLMVS